MPRHKKFSAHWAKSAALDIDSIIEYLASEDLNGAQRVLRKLQQAASRLAVFPKRGRVVPELKEQGIYLYHEVVSAPWRIIYRIEERAVLLMAVIDGRRNLEDLLLQRFLH